MLNVNIYPTVKETFLSDHSDATLGVTLVPPKISGLKPLHRGCYILSSCLNLTIFAICLSVLDYKPIKGSLCKESAP